MTDAPPPQRRGWIDALVATALRWNDRLSHPVGSPPSDPAPRPLSRRAVAAAAERVALSGRKLE